MAVLGLCVCVCMCYNCCICAISVTSATDFQMGFVISEDLQRLSKGWVPCTIFRELSYSQLSYVPVSKKLIFI